MTLGGIAGVANAQTAGADQWHGAVTVYGYFPSLYGETTFPNGASGPTFKIDAHEIVRNLNFAFMGKVHVQKGPWGGSVDFFYADVSESRSGTRDFSVPQIPIPVGVAADLKLGTKSTLLTLNGTYQLVAEPDHDLRLVFGARMYDNRQRLDWHLSAPLVGYPSVSGTSKADKTNWDAIVGVSGRQRFGQDLRWYMPYYVDVGTGDSRFTGQVLFGLGYAFDWGDVTATWRYIDYNFKSGSLIARTSYSGPAVGLTWRF
ncbi:MAG: hypothetical protein JSS21_06880 [Proteobacteria bacterium]|nr:hypothetical protein [Pseudomonadota bacterium]